mmetsp:Transcript_114286/g.243750  ORF Transcript_114286/g.243750 Transcript_114286/m.243750 type:complete len:462 (+) Transcript_114286:68-1453(+)
MPSPCRRHRLWLKDIFEIAFPGAPQVSAVPTPPWEVWYSKLWNCPVYWNRLDGSRVWKVEDAGVPVTKPAPDLRCRYVGVVDDPLCSAPYRIVDSDDEDSVGTKEEKHRNPGRARRSLPAVVAQDVTKRSTPLLREGPAWLSEKFVKASDSHALSACHMAAFRAKESQREDCLFYDPYARILAGEYGDVDGKGDNTAQRCRTKFFDDFVHIKYRQGVRQFVVLGAGMDTRAFRMMNIEHAHFFEVDKKQLFAMKEPLLRNHQARPQCAERDIIALDLAEDYNLERLGQELAGKGYDADRASVWLLEGLLMYLSPDSVNRLVEKLSQLTSPGSVVLFDCCSKHAARMGVHVSSAPWLSGMEDYFNIFPKHMLNILDVISFQRFVAENRMVLIKTSSHGEQLPSVHYARKWQTIRDDCFLTGPYSLTTGSLSGYIVTLTRSMPASQMRHRFATAHLRHFEATL